MEALFEIIGELLFDIIAQVIASLFNKVSNHFDMNKRSKKVFKIIISILIYGGVLVVLGYSLMTRQNTYTLIIGTYFIIMIFFYILLNSIKGEKVKNFVLTLKRIIQYCFPIVMIVFAIVNKSSATIYIIIFSVIGLIVYYCIDYYRYQKTGLIARKEKREKKRAENKLKEEQKEKERIEKIIQKDLKKSKRKSSY